MSFPWDGSENRYQTLLQTKKEQFSDSNSRFPQTQPLDKETFDNQLRVQNDRNHIFSNNSSQILNNPSIPLNIYQINPEQYQQPASQISRREIVLDEKTRKRQEDLLSQSYQNLQNPQNGNLDLNNYIRTPNLQIYQTQEYNRNQNPNFQHQDLNNNFNRNSKQNQNPNHNYNYNRNPNQSYQNLEPINNNSNRNHNVDSFIQQRPDSNARSFLNTRSIIEKPGVSYGQDLKKQVNFNLKRNQTHFLDSDERH